MKKRFTWMILAATIIIWAILIALIIKYPLIMTTFYVAAWGFIFYGLRRAKLVPPNVEI